MLFIVLLVHQAKLSGLNIGWALEDWEGQCSKMWIPRRLRLKKTDDTACPPVLQGWFLDAQEV